MNHRVHPLAPIIALDIDGTLGDYHSHFAWFASLYLQSEVVPVWDADYKGEFSDALGLDKRTYRDIKLAYRQGGMKRSLPLFAGAEGIPRWIRSQDIQVWIATTRPWNRLDNIDPDTQFWIDRNLGKVDGVIYGEEKYSDLVDIVGADRIIGVVDDIPENIIEARNLGLKAMLRRGEHNRWYLDNSLVANESNGIMKRLSVWIEEHKNAR